MLKVFAYALQLACAQPSETIVLSEAPFVCVTDTECENLAGEFGCTEWHNDAWSDYLWCDAATYRAALERHSS